MQTTYIVRFQRPIIIEDHWRIPFMNGSCRVVEADGKAVALEIVFIGEPVTNAALVQELDGPIKLSITGRDHRLNFVKRYLEDASAFLECYYNIELKLDEIEATYAGETADEEKEIDLKSFKMGKRSPTLPLSFDMLTRALLAAETNVAPKFEATLTKDARDAFTAHQFINSFRYSFLLIEATYGNGQFKKKGLIGALCSNRELIDMVRLTTRDMILPTHSQASDTSALLANSPPPETIIEHLVVQRGRYFHADNKRKDAWKSEDQKQAELLALLTIGIAHRISQNSAAAMFAYDLAIKHYNNALNAGAQIVFEIQFKYREPDENFVRDGQLNIRTPGTKVTGRQANSVAHEFLRQFENGSPAGAIEVANCTIQGNNQPIFKLEFLIKPQEEFKHPQRGE